MKRLLLGFIAFVIAAPVYAQQARQPQAQANTTELRVVIVDETGAGIPAATVAVTRASGEPVTFMGDERGRAISPALTAGAVTVAIDYPGFEPYSAPLTLRRGTMDQTITLKIAGLSEEVVVNDRVTDITQNTAATTEL